MAGGLAARAPRLPAFDSRLPVTWPAVTSPDAVRGGIGRGFVHLVEGLAAELAAAAGLSTAARVVTGGEAALLLHLGAAGFEHVPDLVHEGLRWLAERRRSNS
jgi:pantothenate kinase type III